MPVFQTNVFQNNVFQGPHAAVEVEEMKDIRMALRALLLSDATISGYVGGNRVFPVQLPQGQRNPSIVFQRVTGSSDYHLQGDSGLQQSFMQVDAWSPTADASVLLADAAHDVLTGFSGTVFYGSSSPQSEITIRGVFQVNERDLFDDVTQMHRMSRDYNIFYAER